MWGYWTDEDDKDAYFDSFDKWAKRRFGNTQTYDDERDDLEDYRSNEDDGRTV